jgi:hypothetical protein
MSEREDVKVGRIIIIKITHSKTFFLARLGFSYTRLFILGVLTLAIAPNGEI